MSAPVLRRLGKMPVARFMAQYWHRRPLCVRAALPGAPFDLSPERLLALACGQDVESRLVTRSGPTWGVHHGPFTPRRLPPRRRPGWTALVQGVDLHDDAIAALAARFRFVPAARFDDVMVSFATPGGGVGPHVDQYDVFLLQAQGRRRWRIARRFDPALVEGLPLRVLARFRHEAEWVLEPGDLLYLPPGVAHEGVALDECITVSVGFRLPPWQELAETWYEIQGREAPRTGRMADAARRAATQAARLPAPMIEAARRELTRLRPTRRQAQAALLEYLTEPKAAVCFEPAARAPGVRAFAAAARRQGLAADRRTRMLHAAGEFAINGERHALPHAGAAALRRLADERKLEPGRLEKLAGADELFALLYAWRQAGWIHLLAR